jgi:ligand-binding sensor protein
MAFDPENLRLTDFMDLATLQEIQDNFAAVANVKATITDADGTVLTQATPTTEFLRRQRVIQQAEDAQGSSPQKEGREYVAPIMVNDQRLGTIRMAANGSSVVLDESKLTTLSEKYKIEMKPLKAVAAS